MDLPTMAKRTLKTNVPQTSSKDLIPLPSDFLLRHSLCSIPLSIKWFIPGILLHLDRVQIVRAYTM